MNHERRPGFFDWVVPCLGGVVACLATTLIVGCEPAKALPPKPSGIPPMPVARQSVIVMAETSESAKAVAPSLSSPQGVAVKAMEQIEIAASFPATNRGKVTLEWERSPDAVGYRVAYRQGSGPWFYASVGNVTNATIAGLQEGVRYHFICISVDASGVESVPSNEVSKVVPVNISMRQDRWSVESFGVYGQTNEIKMSTNLSEWWTVMTFVGDGSLKTYLHTNQAQAWFRVETK